MSSILEDDLIFHIFMFLDVNVIFTIMTKTTWISLIPNLMKVGFFRYSLSNKAFQIFNQRILKIKESIHVVFDEFSSSDDKIKDENDQEEWTYVLIQSSPKETSKE